MAIKYLTYEISPDCNMDCGFCLADWREEVNEMSTEEAKAGIKLMREKGLEAINFTGGEPLMRRDIGEIVRFAKDLNLITVLSTNGILLEKKLPELSDYIDYIGLPLDSSDAKIHNHIRPTKATNDHFQLVVGLINLLNDNYKKIGVKINTIVTKENTETISGIGTIISGKAISWKLSQFISTGYGKLHEEKYALSSQKYLEILDQCKLEYPEIHIISSLAHERDDCCRFVSSNGDLMKPTASGLVNLGNWMNAPDALILEGFNQRKNERVLKNTYLNAKNE